jgi:DNA-binding CsgD family transcriptional regulator
MSSASLPERIEPYVAARPFNGRRRPLAVVDGNFLIAHKGHRLLLPVPIGKVLSPTEQVVVALALRGLLDKEIAAELWLSVETIKSHLKHSYRKLGLARGRHDLLAFVMGTEFR